MNQVELSVETRDDTGKGAAGRLRKTGRVPAVVYGYDVEPTPVSLDDRELYHALHGPAGTNVLLNIVIDGDTKLCVARDIQRHPVREDVTHVDLLSVDKTQTIVVEIPVWIEGEIDGAGVANQVLGTVPINVAPLDTPNNFELSVDGLDIGDVLRVEDMTDQLPEGASWAIDEERTVLTVNPPEVLDLGEDDDEDLLGLEGEEPGEDAPSDAGDVPATDEGPTNEG